MGLNRDVLRVAPSLGNAPGHPGSVLSLHVLWPDENFEAVQCSALLPSGLWCWILMFSVYICVCVSLGYCRCWAGRKLLCGGGMAREPICPTPPSPSLVAVPGGGFGLGLPHLPCRGVGGPTPTYMAQNDPHVALIILTTHMWEKMCSGTFGGNIRPYTKQRARHGSPFPEPPPRPLLGTHAIPPPQSNFRAALPINRLLGC